MARVMLTCDQCRRQFEAGQAVLQQMKTAPLAPIACERDDCEALAKELERQNAPALAAKPAPARPKFPPKLRELEVPEKATQAAILRYLPLRHVFAWRQNQGAMRMPNEPTPYGARRRDRFVKFAGVDGISDIIGIYKGRFLAIEVKRIGNKPTDDQRAFLERVDKEGGIAIVAYSVDDVVSALDEVDKGAR